MHNLLDIFSEDMLLIVQAAMDDLIGDIDLDQDEILLRRIKQHYDKIPTEGMLAMRDALGHKDGETTPCRVCTLVAQREHRAEG